MNKNEFVKQLTEFCEFEGKDFNLGTTFKSIEGFDSLAIMAIIAFADEKFSKKLTAQQLNKMTDIRSLITLIGEEKFEND
jgi:acyl carrier protein